MTLYHAWSLTDCAAIAQTSVLPTVSNTSPPRGLSPPLTAVSSAHETSALDDMPNSDSLKKQLAAIDEELSESLLDGTALDRPDRLSPSGSETLEQVKDRLDGIERTPSLDSRFTSLLDARYDDIKSVSSLESLS